MLKLPGFLDPRNLFSGPKKDAQLVSDLGNPAAWLLDHFNGFNTLSGENVSHETALQLDSYYACLRNISEDIAKLPFNIFQLVENGKKLVTTHPSQTLIHKFANPNMSTMDLVQTKLHWALSYGNGYAEIVRNAKGEAVEMWPIHPSRMKPFYRSGKLFWEVHGRASNIQGEENVFIILDDEDVFNLRGLGADGIVGYSVFALASDSIGQGLAVQKFASVYFRNGTALSGMLVAPGKLTPDAYANMRESWSGIHEGSAKKKHEIAILEGGLKFEPLSSTASDSQLLESQKFTPIRMARLLRMPPHKIGSTEKIGSNNLEASEISYFRDTLTPWITRISLETDRKIIRSDRFTAKHEVNALTLGDSKTRAGVFKTHRNMGTMSINDVLRAEDLNVIEEPWADEYHMQSNVTTVKNISEGMNLKPKGNGQNSGGKLEPGEEDAEGRGPSEAAITEKVNISDAFTAAKEAHLPNFRYAAKRILTKESKMLEKKRNSFRADIDGFAKWSEHFFEKQKAEIVDVFEPCCHTFVNTFNIEGIELELASLFVSLKQFSDNYATDGISNAMSDFKKNAADGEIVENIEEDEEKLAQAVMNLIAISAKGNENETE